MSQNFIFQPQFNFSLATLNKLNDEMKECNQALKRHNILDYYTMMEIFYKSTSPFLNVEQSKKAIELWEGIQKLHIEPGEDFIEFDSKLPAKLKELDFFLTECLHINGISYSNKEVNKGLDYQYKKYGIDSEP